MKQLSDLFNDGVLIDITVSFWSAAKKLTKQDMGLDKVSEAYTLGRKYLIPKEVIAKFRLIEGRARALVEDSSFKYPIGNARFIPKKTYEKVNVKLQAYKAQYKALVEDLILNYTEYREKMRPVYVEAAEAAYINQLPEHREFGLEFDPEAEKAAFVEQFMARINACYPPVESLRERFDIDWSPFEAALPRIRKADSARIIEDEHVKTQIEEAAIREAEESYRKNAAKLSTFVDDVVGVLREEAVETCRRISNNIANGKVVKSTTIKSLTNFIDKFHDLNFIGDASLEATLDSLRKEIIDAHPTSEFKDNAELKVELKRRLDMVVEQVEAVTDLSSVTGEYRRKINLD